MQIGKDNVGPTTDYGDLTIISPAAKADVRTFHNLPFCYVVTSDPIILPMGDIGEVTV